jgi:hypothetical protein
MKKTFLCFALLLIAASVSFGCDSTPAPDDPTRKDNMLNNSAGVAPGEAVKPPAGSTTR